MLIESAAPGALARARPRLRRARGAEPGARRRLDHALRAGRAARARGGHRPHRARRRRPARAHRRRRPRAGARGGAAGVPARRRRGRGGRAGRAARARRLGPRPARRRLRAAGRHLATQAYLLATPVGARAEPRASRAASRPGRCASSSPIPAKDGYVSITHLFGSTIGPATRRLMEWVHECGFCDEATRDKDWIALHRAADDRPGADRGVRAREAARSRPAPRRRRRRSCSRPRSIERLLIAPARTLAEVVESEQLAARGYFTTLEARRRRAASATPGPSRGSRPRRSATGAARRGSASTPPRSARSARGPRAARRGRVRSARRRRPLEGVKVLDFMWALAGPLATRALADYGATVVRIESSRRLDVCRTILPFLGGEVGAENAALFHTTNAGKRMLTLDPSKPEGRQAVLDLVRWADVVCESFTPKCMKSFGLDYETLRQVKPDLIMLSTCLMGQTGPLAGFAGFGNLAAAMTGFYELTGWPDRPPAGPFGAYTDYIAPRFNAAAILAALEHRRRTGEGQHIDLVAGRGRAPLPRAGDPRLHRERRRRDARRQPRPRAGAARRLPVRGRRTAGWRSRRATTATGARSARRSARPALAADARYATAAARLAQRRRARRARGRPHRAARDGGDRAPAPRARACRRAASTTAPRPRATRSSRIAATSSPVPHPTQGQAVVEAPRFRLSRTPAARDGPRADLRRQHAVGARDACSATTTSASPSSRSRARSSSMPVGARVPHASCRDPSHVRDRRGRSNRNGRGAAHGRGLLLAGSAGALAARALGHQRGRAVGGARADVRADRAAREESRGAVRGGGPLVQGACRGALRALAQRACSRPAGSTSRRSSSRSSTASRTASRSGSASTRACTAGSTTCSSRSSRTTSRAATRRPRCPAGPRRWSRSPAFRTPTTRTCT